MYKVVATIDTPDAKALAEKLAAMAGCAPDVVESKQGKRRLIWNRTRYWVADRILQACRKVDGATVTME